MCATALWPTVNKPFCLMSMACVCACKGGGSEPEVRQRGYFFYHECPVSSVWSDQIQWFLMWWLVWETCGQMFCLPLSNLNVWSILHPSVILPCWFSWHDLRAVFTSPNDCWTISHDLSVDGKMSISTLSESSAEYIPPPPPTNISFFVA